MLWKVSLAWKSNAIKLIEGIDVMNEVFNKLTSEDQAIVMKLADYAEKFHNGMQKIISDGDTDKINKILSDLQVTRPKGKWSKESHDPSHLSVLLKRLITGSSDLQMKLCEHCGMPFFSYKNRNKIYCDRRYNDRPCFYDGPIKKAQMSPKFNKLFIMMNESLSFHRDLVKEGSISEDTCNQYEESLKSALEEYRINPTTESEQKFMGILLRRDC